MLELKYKGGENSSVVTAQHRQMLNSSLGNLYRTRLRFDMGKSRPYWILLQTLNQFRDLVIKKEKRMVSVQRYDYYLAESVCLYNQVRIEYVEANENYTFASRRDEPQMIWHERSSLRRRAVRKAKFQKFIWIRWIEIMLLCWIMRIIIGIDHLDSLKSYLGIVSKRKITSNHEVLSLREMVDQELTTRVLPSI